MARAGLRAAPCLSINVTGEGKRHHSFGDRLDSRLMVPQSPFTARPMAAATTFELTLSALHSDLQIPAFSIRLYDPD